MSRTYASYLAVVVAGLLIGGFFVSEQGLLAGNWPAWRGPHGTGVADETGLPVQWSAEQNVKWKIPLPAGGNSSPIVWGAKVFITQATDQGHTRSLHCYGRAEGKLLWKREVRYEKDQPTHKTNPYCSSSPVTDGQQVVAWHGSAGIYAYDLQGNELWSRDLGAFQHIWGTASSPVLYKDRVILSAGPGLRAFVVALDRQTCDELWRMTPEEIQSEKIEEFRGSWSTPVLYQQDGKDRMLLSLPNRLIAFDPATGEQIWQCRGLSKLSYTSPLVGENIAVAMSGYHGPALAVRLGGEGDVTDSHRLWLHEMRNPQRVGSGVIVGGHVYILNENGVAWCIELESGEIKWEERVGRGGRSWSSTSFVDDRLYVTNINGTTLVLEANPSECKLLAENQVGELTRSSLAFSDGQVFQRTYEHLYCFENSAGQSE